MEVYSNEKIIRLMKFLGVSLLLFFFYEVSHYNLFPLMHWDGRFWGWESSGLFNFHTKFSGELLYESVKFVYPFGGMTLIDALFKVGFMNSYLAIENFLVYFSAILVAMCSYFLSRYYGCKEISVPLFLLTLMVCINVVNPIAYNSVALALSVLSFTALITKRVFLSGVLLALTFLFKQNYGLGIFLGIFVVSVLDAFMGRGNIKGYLYVMATSCFVLLITLLLADSLAVISIGDFFDLIFLSASEQKGGILNLIGGAISTIFRVFDIVLILSVLLLTCILVFMWKFQNQRFIYLVHSILTYIFIAFFLMFCVFSIYRMLNEGGGAELIINNSALHLIGVLSLHVSKSLSFIMLCMFFICTLLPKAQLPSFMDVGDVKSSYLLEIQLLMIMLSFSVFIHMSSQVSSLVSYPNLLTFMGFIFMARLLDGKNKKILSILIYALSVFVLSFNFISEKNGFSLFSTGFQEVSRNKFAREVKFNVESEDAGLYQLLENKIDKDESFIVIPDNLPVSSLFTSDIVQDLDSSCIVLNKFVDMFPLIYLESEKECFLEGMPSKILFVDKEHWTTWAEKFVRKGSAGEQLSEFIYSNLDEYYTLDEQITVNDKSYTLYKRTNK